LSIKILSAVWESNQLAGSELLVALALADFADDAGRCHPAISTVANKTRLSRSQAQRILKSLEDAGVVTVEANAAGGRPGTTKRLRLRIDRLTKPSKTGSADATPTDSTSATGSADATGSAGAADGSHGRAETGSAGATLTVNEPSLTVKGKAEQVKRELAELPGFEKFWETWPRSTRKQAKGKCLEIWKKARAECLADEVLAHVKALAASDEWRRDGGRYIPAPLVYLNQRRWEGVDGGGDTPVSALGRFV
jgi:hypothetical protein